MTGSTSVITPTQFIKNISSLESKPTDIRMAEEWGQDSESS